MRNNLKFLPVKLWDKTKESFVSKSPKVVEHTERTVSEDDIKNSKMNVNTSCDVCAPKISNWTNPFTTSAK